MDLRQGDRVRILAPHSEYTGCRGTVVDPDEPGVAALGAARRDRRRERCRPALPRRRARAPAGRAGRPAQRGPAALRGRVRLACGRRGRVVDPAHLDLGPQAGRLLAQRLARPLLEPVVEHPGPDLLERGNPALAPPLDPDEMGPEGRLDRAEPAIWKAVRDRVGEVGTEARGDPGRRGPRGACDRRGRDRRGPPRPPPRSTPVRAGPATPPRRHRPSPRGDPARGRRGSGRGAPARASARPAPHETSAAWPRRRAPRARGRARRPGCGRSAGGGRRCRSSPCRARRRGRRGPRRSRSSRGRGSACSGPDAGGRPHRSPAIRPRRPDRARPHPRSSGLRGPGSRRRRGPGRPGGRRPRPARRPRCAGSRARGVSGARPKPVCRAKRSPPRIRKWRSGARSKQGPFDGSDRAIVTRWIDPRPPIPQRATSLSSIATSRRCRRGIPGSGSSSGRTRAGSRPNRRPVGRRHEGIDAVMALMGSGLGLYDLTRPMEIERTASLAGEALVYVEMTIRATTKAGEPYENHYVMAFQIADGRIAEVREYVDSLYAQHMLFDPAGQPSPPRSARPLTVPPPGRGRRGAPDPRVLPRSAGVHPDAIDPNPDLPARRGPRGPAPRLWRRRDGGHRGRDLRLGLLRRRRRWSAPLSARPDHARERRPARGRLDLPHRRPCSTGAATSAAKKASTHASTSFQNTPILVDRTLYLCTPFNRVIALDPETGGREVDLRSAGRSRGGSTC
jgi:hypothetical protein